MYNRRAGSYWFALEWIALNDDTSWLASEDGGASMTLCLVADTFYRTVEEATDDLKKVIKKHKKGALDGLLLSVSIVP